MKLDITKVANVILYMLENNTKHLNDKKLSVLLFLMEYEHFKKYEKKIFNVEFTKQKRNPEPLVLSEIFDIIANSEDLEEDDERLYLITELLDYLDIEIHTKENFIELTFIKMEEDFDDSLFYEEELETIDNILSKYKDATPRNVANACFQLEEVRKTPLDEIIL